MPTYQHSYMYCSYPAPFRSALETTVPDILTIAILTHWLSIAYSLLSYIRSQSLAIVLGITSEI